MKKGFASIVCVDDADKYVIYVLDSVITARASSARGVLQEALECARQCGLCIHNSGNGTVIIEPSHYLNDLDAWRDVAKCYVKCLVEQALKKTSKEVSSESIDVAVSAAIGKLGWTYESSFPDLIASELFRCLWSSISKAVDDSVEKLEIDLDVTHGVNFMPTLSYQIVRYLATLLLIEKRNLNNVVIKVYNAVPVGTQQSAAGVRTFQYVEVFHESLNYIQIPHDIGGEVARAIELGAIPVIYEACQSGKSEVDLRVEASICYDNKTVTYRHSGSANFKRHISLAIKKAACSTATSRLKKLMSHHLTKKLAPPARELLYGELNSLFNTIEEVKNLGKDVPDDGILYSQLLDVRAGREPSSSVDGCKCRDDREKRNFIAHAGLLKDCVKIKKCGDDYCLEIPSELLECLK